MKRTEAIEAVREALPLRRFEHTMRVVETAEQLARQYGGDADAIQIAAVLHDYAKYRDPEDMLLAIRRSGMFTEDIAGYGTEILHAFAGALFVEKELHVDSPAVLQAIASHTTGRAGMSVEEKIVFLADYIEPGRTFSGAAKARDAAKHSLEAGCMEACAETIQFLSDRRLPIFPDTFEAYNEFALGRLSNR
ncbi:bis(5'-nucleosyl)-tetraphosphatase (symmetrical) YqeK [Alkalicoccus luteus]|uniref:bis(5'-nucleosyl)-tetraphosphatase (symmetrical) n=1 Tax=Alkalicoccus luteus TaxID=1237094 RepID=A0A969TTZ3_9BACI|nr:bis(5'-nucleosyl)-tetraphosphatase (symmetrical) YqeK [Alkalicoccus luteus]NJP36517.1 HD domain-containing protein [Alkalicoccus luteus]